VVDQLVHSCGKPFSPAGNVSYTGTEARSLLNEEAGNRPTETLTRQDATDPKQKSSNILQRTSGQTPPPSTRKLKTGEPIQPQRT